ncbi:hypothetical protein SE17_34900 [Kouleothrix aurantiaca]|uniref:Uncharacterized protein n=1 Tax=Kouleothrix aurantiaca TaxID=186479 RepID=A0A0P9D944_9CHLR|nr:hypothetical protein SE17_34900 [Kouleothrix aurantiaca]
MPIQRATPQANVVVPAHHNFLGWLCDPVNVSGTTTPGAGTLQLARILIPQTIVVNTITLSISIAPTTCTSGQNFVGIYDQSGTRLGVSVDQSTAWATNGQKACAMASATTVPGGLDVFVWVAFLWNGTGSITLHRPTIISNIASIGLTGATMRMGTILTGQTSLPSSITPASITNSTNVPWIGIS